MLKTLIISFFILFSSLANAQYASFSRIEKKYNALDYEGCIELSKKAIDKNSKELVPYAYLVQSYYQLYKQAENEKNAERKFKKALSYAAKLSKKDKEKRLIDEHKLLLDSIHTIALDYGDERFYAKELDKAKYYYNYVAKIFKDSTENYRLLLSGNVSQSSTGLNTVSDFDFAPNLKDGQGRKQGKWARKYSNGNFAYQVTFIDDKPIGEFKRFFSNGEVKAILIYDNKSEFATAKIFNKDGSLAAEGNYFGTKRDSLWIFYKNEIIIAEENYTLGIKNGISRSYYGKNRIAEERHWVNGVEHGVWRQFYLSGGKKLESKIIQGERTGPYYLYYENGRFELLGHYKADLMHGTWKYYEQNGTLRRELIYVDGVAKNSEELEEEEQELFRIFEKNRVRLVDPADYKMNPTEYMRKQRNNN